MAETRRTPSPAARANMSASAKRRWERYRAEKAELEAVLKAAQQEEEDGEREAG